MGIEKPVVHPFSNFIGDIAVNGVGSKAGVGLFYRVCTHESWLPSVDLVLESHEVLLDAKIGNS